MVTLRDYPPIEVQAARAVLLELAHLLGEYRQDVVLVGGWVPELLFPEAELTYVGSLDVDLALNHRSLDDAGYRTIHELLVGREYYQKPDGQPFQYFRRVQTADGQEVIVPVDFLAGEYGGRGRKHRSQRVSGMQPRKARGCDLAFSEPTQIHLEGRLPAGPMDSAILNVVDVTAFIIMKAMAVEGRLNEKDPWDIYFCLCSYPGGTAALAERFKPRLKNGLVREGLQIIADKFASVDHYGRQRSPHSRRSPIRRRARSGVVTLLSAFAISWKDSVYRRREAHSVGGRPSLSTRTTWMRGARSRTGADRGASKR